MYEFHYILRGFSFNIFSLAAWKIRYYTLTLMSCWPSPHNWPTMLPMTFAHVFLNFALKLVAWTFAHGNRKRKCSLLDNWNCKVQSKPQTGSVASAIRTKELWKATANSCLLLAKVLLVSVRFVSAARNHSTLGGHSRAYCTNSQTMSINPHTHTRTVTRSTVGQISVCMSGRKFLRNLHIYSIQLSARLQVHCPYPSAICLQAQQQGTAFKSLDPSF